MIQEEKTEGIVLRSLDYKDNQRIITLFTPQGLLSLIVKGLNSRNTQLTTLTSPFSQGEFLFKRGRSDLLSFLDGSLIDSHLFLREQLSSIETASALSKVILTSQLAGKCSFELYALFCCYLKQIPSFASPSSLLASFQLKLLTHEGLLLLSKHCNRCKAKDAHFLSKGECLCQDHPLEEAFSFFPEEWDYLIQLQEAKQFSVLRRLILPKDLAQKITFFFQYRITHQ